MDPFKTFLLTQEDIKKIIDHVGITPFMDQLIDRLNEEVKNFDKDLTHIPIRSGFSYTEPSTGLIEWMPLYEKSKDVVIKLVGYHPSNPSQYGLPTIISTISVYDTATGHLSGLLDGVIATALRTGASSAVASMAMAHPESKVLGLIGCGAQAVAQMHAICSRFEIDRVLVHDINEENERSLQERSESFGNKLKMEIASKKQVVMESDILCTATSIDVGMGPLFDDIETKEHLHINAVGSDFPGKVELPKSLLKKSFVCPDFLDQALVEGECQQLDPQDISPDWVEVLRKPSSFEGIKETRTVFDSTGWSLEDKVVACLFLDLAQELKIGQLIQLENLKGDALNPYHFIASMAPALNTNS